MRYSKWSLLLFGAGMVLGLAVVSARLSGLARVASLAMAGGIVLLPVAFVADWRRKAVSVVTRRKKPAARPRRAAAARPGTAPRRAAPARRRTRRKRP